MQPAFLIMTPETNSKRPKSQRTGSPDDFQTPTEAIGPLLPLLPKGCTVWEPACGNGNLVRAFIHQGFNCIGTDIKTGHNFIEKNLENSYDCIITNPPFSIKHEFLKTCNARRKPFALLLPLSTLESQKRQKLFNDYGLEIILLNKRVNFETPNQVKNSCSWFATAWFTWGFNLGRQLVFETIPKNLTQTKLL